MSERALLRLPAPDTLMESNAAPDAGTASASAPAAAPAAAPQSYKIEVIADNSGEWVGNGVRLRTKAEAEAYGPNLANRWLEVREWRVSESDEAPNYSFTNGELTHL